MKNLIILLSSLSLLGCQIPENSEDQDAKFFASGIDRSPSSARSGVRDNRGNAGLLLRSRVLVVSTYDPSGMELSGVMTNSLVKELRKNPKLNVIQNARVNDLVGRLDKSQAMDSPLILSEAKKLGVQSVVLSQILHADAKSRGDEVGLLRERVVDVNVEVDLRVIEVSSGREIISDIRRYNTPIKSFVLGQIGTDSAEEKQRKHMEKGLADIAADLAKQVGQFAGKLTWKGKVAKIIGPNLYINAGKSTGIQAGDILKITKAGEDIYDPETGTLIGRAEGRVKGTVEVVSFVGEDGAMCLLHSGGGFVEQDIVSLY